MAVCDVAIYGLGTMGAALALNIAEKGFDVGCFNRTYERTKKLLAHAGPLAPRLHGYEKLQDLVAALKVPRKVLILVEAGKATDGVIEALCNALSPNDVIVDTGNAHFKDQTRRGEALEAKGFRFLGMGISGGEEGARKGPAFFPGGTLSVWEEIRPIIEAAAAKAEDGRPCVTMNGRGGAGSCVKMFHNAGEYAILQIWGEVFSILRSAGLSNVEIASTLDGWKKRGFLDSYMLDISIEVCKAKDADGSELTYKVVDKIGSKGTGLWSAMEALEIGVPVPSLNMAVVSRQLTMFRTERSANANSKTIQIQPGQPLSLKAGSEEVEDLYHGAVVAIIACYAQMFQALRELDRVHKFGLNLPRTIATFRAGCILQGYMLNPMAAAFEANPNLSNLMCAFPQQMNEGLPRFRRALAAATAHTDLPTPVLSSSLAYVNAMFKPELLYGQMVALQRDVFGRHGFQRIDTPQGTLSNHNWPDMQ